MAYEELEGKPTSVNLEQICSEDIVCKDTLMEGITGGPFEYKVRGVISPAIRKNDAEKYQTVVFGRTCGDVSGGMTIDYCITADHGLSEGDIINGRDLLEHPERYSLSNGHFRW